MVTSISRLRFDKCIRVKQLNNINNECFRKKKNLQIKSDHSFSTLNLTKKRKKLCRVLLFPFFHSSCFLFPFLIMCDIVYSKNFHDFFSICYTYKNINCWNRISFFFLFNNVQTAAALQYTHNHFTKICCALTHRDLLLYSFHTCVAFFFLLFKAQVNLSCMYMVEWYMFIKFPPIIDIKRNVVFLKWDFVCTQKYKYFFLFAV